MEFMVKYFALTALSVCAMSSGARAESELKSVYQIEIATVPGGEEFLVLKKSRDSKGPAYFIGYRRGKAMMWPVSVSEKRFSEWKKSIEPFLNRARLAARCPHPLEIRERQADKLTAYRYCPPAKGANRGLASVANPIIKYYRHTSGWK